MDPKPPIPSPFGDESPAITLSRRVEWDFERECFVLRFINQAGSFLRCELFTGMRRKRVLLMWLLGWPLMLLTAAITMLADRSRAKPEELLIFAWGVETFALGNSFQTHWEEITRVSLHRDDVYIDRTSAHLSNYYLCRENFADDAERTRFLGIMESLRAGNGANWEAVVRHFRREISP